MPGARIGSHSEGLREQRPSGLSERRARVVDIAMPPVERNLKPEEVSKKIAEMMPVIERDSNEILSYAEGQDDPGISIQPTAPDVVKFAQLAVNNADIAGERMSALLLYLKGQLEDIENPARKHWIAKALPLLQKASDYSTLIADSVARKKQPAAKKELAEAA